MPTREQVAYILWLGGFGQDPDRNWYMAGFLLEEEGFAKMVAEAQELKEQKISDPDEGYLRKEGWVRKFAELLYDTSYHLADPSDNPDANWNAAVTFWAALG